MYIRPTAARSRSLPTPLSIFAGAFAIDGEGSTADGSTGDIRRGDPKGVLLAPDAQLRMYW